MDYTAIQRLPPELLKRIFSFTLDPPANPVFQTPSSLHPTGMPWVSAHVCKSWSKHALSTSSLWNFISLALPSGEASQTFLDAQMHRLNSQLHRSRNRGLDIIISTRKATNLAHMNPLLVLLSLRSRSWRSLYIELDGRIASTISLMRGHLSSLESLHVRCVSRPTEEFNCFEFAPKLRTVEFHGGEHTPPNEGANFGRFPLKLPYGHIKQFRYSQTTADSFPLYHALKHLGISLHTCQLSLHSNAVSRFLGLQERSGFSDDFPPVLLPNLMELHFSPTPSYPGSEAMLSRIKVASSLKFSTISFTGETRTPFEKFFTAPSSLTTLVFYRVEMPAAKFSSLLTILTGLKTLGFGVHNGITNAYLEPLRTDCTIVPKLQILYLYLTPGVQSRYDDETLLSLLECRLKSRGSGSCLKFVTLNRRTVSEPVRSRLDKLRGKGMRIREPEDN
ncbi:hypothetical protein L218DRAFT_1081829 [Marasmius fiardii PR-910]|nr:hypothetical protein L218DRAFT_1081829 [Marasmius fiardii PR-910]